MALSLLNYTFWEIPDARMPFIVADCFVLFSLYFIDRGVKADKEMREVATRQELEQNNKIHKEETRGMKTAQKYRAMNAKRTAKHQPSNVRKPQTIQQPSKRD